MTGSNKEHILVAVALALVVLTLFAITTFDGDTDNKQPVKIGLVLTGSKNDEGWNGKQYAAMQKVCAKYGLTLLVKEYIAENTGDCPRAIQDLARDGAGMIFLSSFAYPEEAKTVVGRYPHIAFGTNSAEYTAKNMSAYFARLYQTRYLSGIIAGMRTQTNVLGYVAAMPNAEVNRGINAFALGAQSVNPTVKVIVIYTGSWQDEAREKSAATRLVQEAGADVLTYHQNQNNVADVAELLGVDFIGYHEAFDKYSAHCLTSVVCRWEAYYGNIVERYLRGAMNSDPVNWLGIERDVIYLSRYSDRVTEPMRGKVERARQNMLDGYLIFSGEIYDNRGRLRCEADEALSDGILLKQVDWLVKGVEVLD